AAVDRPDDVVVGHEHVVEEDLVELGVPGRHLETAHLDAGGLHVDHHRGDAVVLRHVGIRAHGREAELRHVATARPHLLALAPPFGPWRGRPPSVRVPRVLIPAASEPASGSLNSWHQMRSWRSAGGTQRATWSSFACWISVRITQPVMPYAGRLTPAASNSC